MFVKKILFAYTLIMTSYSTFSQSNLNFIQATIICEMKDEWLENRKLPLAKQYPIPLNINEVENKLKVKSSIFENYPNEHELSYSYFVSVNAKGDVTKIEFLVIANGYIDDIVQSSIKKIKFKPAMKDNKPINSFIIIEYKLKCVNCK